MEREPASRGARATLAAMSAIPVVMRRETKARAGREVTTLAGLAHLGDAKVRALASDLKKLCAAGGGVDGATIVLQGDHRDRVQAELEKRGFTVKRAGG
ncbi:MAG: hypothetical protein HMLKMBBP_00011 [Planctomycetes bacterium]|nr:hypothetical protein [Planctomycetota bacterium]